MRVFTPFLLLLFLSACAHHADQREMTESRHYKEASKLLEKKNYLSAIEELEELEARFPYGDYTEQAQLDLIYARFKALDYVEAAAQADRFVRTYPAHPHLDYALYLKGLSNFYMDLDMFDRLSETDKAARDLTSMRDAFQDFNQVVTRFPQSAFTPDAHQRMIYIRNLIADQELHAARYYARRHAFVASASRAQFVIRHFQGTPAVPEALAILSKSYEELEQPALANKSLRVLQTSWPDSPYLDDGAATLSWWPRKERRWLSLLTFDLL